MCEEAPRKTSFRTFLGKYAGIFGTALVLILISSVWLWRQAQPFLTFSYSATARNLAYSPDGALMGAICSKTGGHALGVVLWDTHTWKPIRTLPGNVYWFWFTSDGRYIVTISSNDQTDSAQARHDEAALKKVHPRWSSSQVQSWLYDHETQSVLQCWDAYDITPPKTAVIPGSVADSFSADGLWVFFNGPDDRQTLWDAETGRVIKTLGKSPSPVWVTFSPDKRFVASGDIPQHIDRKGDWKFETGKQGLWDLQTGQRVTALDGQVKGVLAVQFSHNGHLLAIETANALTLWQTSNWKLLHTVVTEPMLYNNRLRFSHDDRYLIGGGVSGTQMGINSHAGTQFWDVGTGKIICERKDEEFERLSPDGHLAVTQDDIRGATTYHLHLWDTTTGRLIMTIPGAEDPAFAPDGKTLLAVNTQYQSRSGLEPMSYVPKQTAIFHLWELPQTPGK